MELLLIVIVLGGLGGGLASYLVRDQASTSPTENPGVVFFGALLAGVVASFCVPLFLLLTQSKLLEGLLDDAMKTDPKGNLQYDLDLLYIAGFCLIAAYSARAFLQSISARILQEVQEAKQESKAAQLQSAEAKQMVATTSGEVQTARQSIQQVADIARTTAQGVRSVAEHTRKVEALTDKLTEAIENPPAAPAQDAEEEAYITEEMAAVPPGDAAELSAAELAVLRTLDNPNFQFRTSGRIGAESGVTQDDLPRILQGLAARRLLRSTIGRTGTELYTLTHLGRHTLDAHHAAG